MIQGDEANPKLSEDQTTYNHKWKVEGGGQRNKWARLEFIEHY